MDLGNYAVVSLVLVQFASSGAFSLITLTAGIIFAVICYVISYIISSWKEVIMDSLTWFFIIMSFFVILGGLVVKRYSK